MARQCSEFCFWLQIVVVVADGRSSHPSVPINFHVGGFSAAKSSEKERGWVCKTLCVKQKESAVLEIRFNTCSMFSIFYVYGNHCNQFI